jgi:SHS2 domain-containing protein
MSKNKKFEFLEHTADVKFQSFGKSLEEAFVNSGLALKSVITRNENIKSKIKKQIQIKEKEIKNLKPTMTIELNPCSVTILKLTKA